MSQPSKNEVYTPVDFLLNTSLLDVQRMNSSTLFIFEHSCSLNVLVDWYWLYDGEFSREEPRSASKSAIDTAGNKCSVIGITFYCRTAALAIHLSECWTLQVSPRNMASVAWVACNGADQVVYANSGKIERLCRNQKM